MELLKKKNPSKDLLYYGLILILSVLISLPFFKGQFVCGADYAGTLMRALAMKQCLRAWPMGCGQMGTGVVFWVRLSPFLIFTRHYFIS